MAATKVSELSAALSITDDSLFLISYTGDNGSSYQTRNVTAASLTTALASTKADLDVDDIESVLGVIGGSTDLGTTGLNVVADNSTVKAAILALDVYAGLLDTRISGNDTDIATINASLATLSLSDLTDGGDVLTDSTKVTDLTGTIVPDTEPTNYLFLVVDQSDGSVKALDLDLLQAE